MYIVMDARRVKISKPAYKLPNPRNPAIHPSFSGILQKGRETRPSVYAVSYPANPGRVRVTGTRRRVGGRYYEDHYVKVKIPGPSQRG